MTLRTRACLIASLLVAAAAQAQQDTGRYLDPAVITAHRDAMIDLGFRRTQPSLGSMGVLWRIRNLTGDELEVHIEKRYHCNSRLVKRQPGTLFLKPHQTLAGGNFQGDLDLADHFFYGPKEDLRKGEVIDHVAVTVRVVNKSEARRADAARQEQREREQQAARARTAEQQRRQQEADAERQAALRQLEAARQARLEQAAQAARRQAAEQAAQRAQAERQARLEREREALRQREAERRAAQQQVAAQRARERAEQERRQREQRSRRGAGALVGK